MKKILEILRLEMECGLSYRQIAKSCNISRPVVSEYLRRAKELGVESWAEIKDLTEEELEKKLNLCKELEETAGSKPMPDCGKIQAELRNKNVTLMLLWEEYKREHSEGYGYVQFWNIYRGWQKKQDYCLRQEHRGGEKLFVDYCDGLEVVNQKTGEVKKTQLFVAVWGASNYTYAEASWSQDLSCWTNSHVKALEYFGCVPKIVVPDNLRSAVGKACRYEPELNWTYEDLSRHYNFAVIPARVRKPRDKAKAEAGVLVVQRWILAALRHKRFFSLVELNEAIKELLEKLNGRPMRKIKKSRKELFDQYDRPNAKGLAERRWEYCEWKKAKVNLDYHVEIKAHYYSVPCRWVHETVEVRMTTNTIEIFYKGTRVASHVRSLERYKHTTVKDHMPPSHQYHTQWTPTRIVDWASKTGPWTSKVVETMLSSRQHPEQAYRSALGLLRLGQRAEVGAQRLENACRRAVEYRSCSYKSVRSILEKGMDRYVVQVQTELHLPALHENIRGSQYYSESVSEVPLPQMSSDEQR